MFSFTSFSLSSHLICMFFLIVFTESKSIPQPRIKKWNNVASLSTESIDDQSNSQIDRKVSNLLKSLSSSNSRKPSIHRLDKPVDYIKLQLLQDWAKLPGEYVGVLKTNEPQYSVSDNENKKLKKRDLADVETIESEKNVVDYTNALDKVFSESDYKIIDTTNQLVDLSIIEELLNLNSIHETEDEIDGCYIEIKIAEHVKRIHGRCATINSEPVCRTNNYYKRNNQCSFIN